VICPFSTKTAAWAMDGAKTYRFTVRWGERRDTDDAEGAVIETSTVRPGRNAVHAVLGRFTGNIVQRPPRYSAIRLDGRRSYELARAAVDFEPPERTVAVEALELLAMPDADHAVFRMRCGKGAYVRSLARDLAAALGTAGYAADIRRLAVGPFAEEDSIPLDILESLVHSAPQRNYLLPVETVLVLEPLQRLRGRLYPEGGARGRARHHVDGQEENDRRHEERRNERGQPPHYEAQHQGIAPARTGRPLPARAATVPPVIPAKRP